MSRSKRALQGGAMTLVQLVVQILLQVVVAPVVLHFAGQDALGAYAAIMQFLGYAMAIDSGFYVVLLRYFAREYDAGSVGPGFMRVMATARRFIAGANVIYAVAICVLGLFVGETLNLHGAEVYQAQTGLFILAGWTAARIPLLVASFALVSVQDLAVRNGIAAIASITRFGVTLALVVLGYGLTGLIIGYLAGDLLDQLACWLRFRQLHSEKNRAVADGRLLMEMLKLSGSTLLIMIGSRLLFFSDNLIAGLLTSAAAASIFYTTQMPGTFGWLTISRITDNAMPGVNEVYHRLPLEQLRQVYLRLHRYVFLLSMPFAVALLLFNRPMVRLWVGAAQFGGTWMTVGLAGVAVLVTAGGVDYTFMLASGKLRVYSLIYCGAGLLKFVLSVYFYRWWGLPGVILATIPAALTYVTCGQMACRRHLALTGRTLFTASLLPAALPAILTGVIVAPLCWRWPVVHWLGLIGYCALFAIIYGLLAWRGLAAEEQTIARAKWDQHFNGFKTALFGG